MKPHKNRIALLFIVIFTISVSFVKAQNVEFSASAPRVVEVGEQFRLSFSVNAKGAGFKEPNMQKFRILTGPNVSTSSSVQIINGNVTRSVSYTYNYVLTATEAGKFTIQPAKIRIKGKDYQSNSLSIEVVQGASASQQGAAQQNQGAGRGNQTTVDKANIGNDQLFVAVNVNKKSLYQGESLVAEVKVYTKVSLSGYEELKLPQFTGFWSQDIESPQQISLQRENVNGQIYNAGLLKKVLLFPQRSGNIKIEPFEATWLVQKRVRSNSPFDDFFGGSYKNVPQRVKSAPVTIKVKPLPPNPPSDFKGAVGNFTLSANVDKTQVKANEAVNLKIRISGNGNLKLIKPLDVDFPPDLDVYDPKTSLNTKASVSGVNGSVSYEYLFIPRFAGTYRIAPIKFSYFDTKTKTYKTLSSKEFEINVERGSGDGEIQSGVVQGLSKEDVRFIGKDVRFLKTKTDLKRKETFVFGTFWFFAIYVVVMLVFALLLIIRRTQIKQNANQAKLKNRKAGRLSQKRLKIAASYLKQNESEKFYDELLKAVWGYLSDKLNIPLADLNKDNVFEALNQKLIDQDLQSGVKDLLDTCEFARYAPSAVSGGMEKVYKDASNLISKLDQKIK